MMLLSEFSLSTLDVVHCMDAIRLMECLPAASVDGIVSDTPYDMTELDFEQAISWSAFWREARRILTRKNSPVILFSQQPFTTDLITSNRRGWRYEIIWEKTMPVGFLDSDRRPMRCHENIQVFADAMPDYFPQMESTTAMGHSNLRRISADHYGKHGFNQYEDTGKRYPRSVWKFAQRNTSFANTKTLHPTEKPVSLMERLILTYTRAGEVILDPFAGSGSTLVAARKNGRHFIGNDLDRKYVELARSRVNEPFTRGMFNEPVTVTLKATAPIQRSVFAGEAIALPDS